MKCAVTILILLAVFQCATAQEHQQAGAQKKLAPVILMKGMGNHHHPISTKSPLAQKFFDQGLILIYGFNHAEAIRSFQNASELDPEAAMPLWGIALALGPNYNLDVDPAAEKAAYDAVQKALAAAPKAPENERAYIEALAKRYSNDPKPDLKQLSRAYSNAMGELMRKYPDDLDTATLYAESKMNLNPWRLWTLDGKPAEGTEEIVTVLESVLQRDPNHPGANHYYIHATEASPNPESALPSAKRLETLVPAAGHLVHMPAHTYIRTGDYQGAARQNDVAAKVDEAYIKRAGVQGFYPNMYYNHNVHFYSVACMIEGKFVASKKAADKLAVNTIPIVPHLAMFEVFVPQPYFVLLRFHKWSEVLNSPEPAKGLPVTTAIHHYARGVAFASTGKIQDAENEKLALVEASKPISADLLFGQNPATVIIGIAGMVLDAEIAEAKGDTNNAIDLWKKAVEAEDKLYYDEPSDWYYPIRESLGAILFRNGQFEAAEEIFREDLQIHPRNGRALFGLMETLKAQKKTTDARFVELQFKGAWENADAPLSMNSL
jgi:tetratricopeptide (TPR) repeat protein